MPRALAAGGIAGVAVGLMPARSGAAVALALWTVGLAAVVYFPKHNWAVGPSPEGTIHRVASIVAFLSLPVAALLLALGAVERALALTEVLVVLSLAWWASRAARRAG